MSKKNILQEAIAESNLLKEAAVENAKSLLMEHFKDTLREAVDSQLNETASDTHRGVDVAGYAEETIPEGASADGEGCDDEEEEEEEETMPENFDLAEEFDPGVLDAEEEDEEEEVEDDLDDDEEEESVDEGLTFEDLERALGDALQEVSHGKLGDPQEITPDKHGRGLLDDKTGSEKPWDEQAAPNAEDRTVKESRYKAKIVSLIKENLLYKKAYTKLRKQVNEVKLFNAQLYFANKLLNTYPQVTKEHKKQIVSRLEKAGSLQEAKLIYESFNMAFSAINGPAKAKKASRLTEALGFDKSTSERGVSSVSSPHLNEGADPFARMRRLAGITKE